MAFASVSIADLNTSSTEYTFATATVTFPAGVAGKKFVTIPITVDALMESPEVGTLSRDSISGAIFPSQNSPTDSAKEPFFKGLHRGYDRHGRSWRDSITS